MSRIGRYVLEEQTIKIEKEMGRCETEKRKNAELRKIIVSKEEAMQLQIKEDTKLRRKLDMVIYWIGKRSLIALASLESHMKAIDRRLNEIPIENEESDIID